LFKKYPFNTILPLEKLVANHCIFRLERVNHSTFERSFSTSRCSRISNSTCEIRGYENAGTKTICRDPAIRLMVYQLPRLFAVAGAQYDLVQGWDRRPD